MYLHRNPSLSQSKNSAMNGFSVKWAFWHVTKSILYSDNRDNKQVEKIEKTVNSDVGRDRQC